MRDQGAQTEQLMEIDFDAKARREHRQMKKDCTDYSQHQCGSLSHDINAYSACYYEKQAACSTIEMAQAKHKCEKIVDEIRNIQEANHLAADCYSAYDEYIQ